MYQRISSLLSFASNHLRCVAGQKFNNRSLFGYIRIAFNKVDEARLKEIGPDRLCAEW